MWSDNYIRAGLTYKMGGREPPALDCFGLYRLARRNQMDDAVDDHNDALLTTSAIRRLRREAGRWHRVAAMSGRNLIIATGEQEMACDLVLMRAVIGWGEKARVHNLHCGIVVEPGLMMDIDEQLGVQVRRYYSSGKGAMHPGLYSRIVGVFRPQ